MLRSSLLVVFLVAPDSVFRAWVPSRAHCSQQFLTIHFERSTWPATRRVDQPAVFIPMIRPLSNSLNFSKFFKSDQSYLQWRNGEHYGTRAKSGLGPQAESYIGYVTDVSQAFGLLVPCPPGVFVEWAQNEIAVVPDFHKRILFSDEAHFWLNGYVNKQNCRIWSEANPQVYVETPLHPEKLTVWCALWAGGILLQKR
ncbi:uncharacterized protein TNCV_3457571 [Trichonephila clavipes]|nr:uncharacterized protein TNCV_3457571 [Trichonephila clavipes]